MIPKVIRHAAWYRYLRKKWFRWKRRDRRPHCTGDRKFAINRDGDLFLVECPRCHRQDVFPLRNVRPIRYKGMRLKPFDCCICGYGGDDGLFFVNPEDGVVKLRDYRRGNLVFPATVVYDEYGHGYLGIWPDQPWWWRARDIYPDLRDGRDGHGHAPYITREMPIYSECKEITDGD